MSLRPPSGLSQLMHRQNSLYRVARVGGDQGAQERHFFNGEVATVIAALDRAGHAGARNSRLRSSLIDHGSHGDRQSGGLPPFFAHAVSHAFSQRRTSMPFIESVPTTEYRIAVNSAPFTLSERCERSQAIAGPLRILSAKPSYHG